MQQEQKSASKPPTKALLPTLMQHALEHYNAGRLTQAETLCQQVLSAMPNHADALHILGVIAHKTGRNEAAIDLIRRAIRASPLNSSMFGNLGSVFLAQGKWAEAADSYRQVIVLKPNDIDAYTNLGAALFAKGDLDEAAVSYHQALRLKPNLAFVHCNLGGIFQARGRLDEAAASYQHALALNPDHVETLGNLGLVFQAQGKLDEAAASYQRAIALKPNYAEALGNLGSVFLTQGKLDEAAANYQQAVIFKPDYAEGYNNLGLVFQARGKLDEAVTSFNRALELNPNFASAYNNLGNAFKAQSKLDEAIASFHQAIKCKPGYAEALSNLGNMFRIQGKLEEAVMSYRQALESVPDFASALVNLGAALQAQDKMTEAISSFRQAIAVQPDLAPAYINMGTAFFSQGQLDEAVSSYRKALVLQPDHDAVYSNLLMVMLYMSNYSPADIFAEYQRFAERFETPLKAQWLAHENKRDVNKRLKIGYVSADFRTHAVAFFIEPILAHHTKTQVEVFAYHSNSMHDQMSDRLQALVDHWVPCIGLSEEQLAERIRADGIDILVDLSGHTGGNRLLAFARKPAPVQVTWIGFLSTTGLSAMDYRLTDDALDPVGMTEAFHSEVLVRLPSSATFTPSPDSPPVNNLPALSGAPFTFACLNNLAKINQPVIRLWSRILSALPDAKLMLGNAAEHETQQHLIRMFMQEGIAVERLILQPKMPLKDFLILHQQIDLALDPFPYGGGTTSNHSLWMGVPVITLAGRNAVARHGVAILKSAGLSEFITHSEEEYVELALKLANDLPRLNQIRQTLRERILAQPERDPEQLTQSLEAAYRTMWEKWCST
jgi:predicted O-linked N-acetylglucosamine transferase (SPINDLY family)